MRPATVVSALILLASSLLSSAMPNPVAEGTVEARATAAPIAALTPPDDDPIDVTLPYPVQQCQNSCKGKFVTCTGCIPLMKRAKNLDFGLQFCKDHRMACKQCCLTNPNGNYCVRTYFPPNLPKE
jgi:hypothetical protein